MAINLNTGKEAVGKPGERFFDFNLFQRFLADPESFGSKDFEKIKFQIKNAKEAYDSGQGGIPSQQTLDLFDQIGGALDNQERAIDEGERTDIDPDPEAAEDDGSLFPDLDPFLEEHRDIFEDFISTEEEKKRTKLQELSSLLTGARETAFAENAPDILESLGSRGLLRSSAVGEELASEKGRLQKESDRLLSMQGIADESAISGFRESAVQSEIGLLTAFQGREFSKEDFERSASLARELAKIGASSQKSQSQAELTGGIFDFLGQLGGGWLAGR